MARFVVAKDVEQKVLPMVVQAVVHIAEQVEDQAKRNAPPVKHWLSQRDPQVRREHVLADVMHGPGRGGVPDNLRFTLPSTRWDRERRAVGPWSYIDEPPHEGDSRAYVLMVNCFPGDTFVRPIGRLEGIIRAPYVGDMVTVRTASGRVLTGTPNHPALTDRGWVSLGSLDVGDGLVDAGWGQVDLAAAKTAGVHPDVEDAPVRLDQVFNALADRLGTQRVPGAAVDFYGDRPAGDVDVVRADRDLWPDVQAALAQRRGDLPLSQREPRLRVGLAVPGAVLERLRCVALAAARGVCGLHPRLALLGSRLGLPEQHRFAAAADWHLSGEQDLPQGGTGDAVLASKGEFGRALRVLPRDAVAEVRVEKEWSGHVFTLTCSTDIYGAAGLVVRNCRCRAVRDPDGIAKLIATEAPILGPSKVTVNVVAQGDYVVQSEFGTVYPGDLIAPGSFYMRRAAVAVAAKRRTVTVQGDARKALFGF